MTARKTGIHGASSTANTPGPVRKVRTVSRSRRPRTVGSLDWLSALVTLEPKIEPPSLRLIQPGSPIIT